MDGRVLKNPREYQEKYPTNLRLEAEIKKLARQEAKEKGTTLSEIMNDALSKRYNVKRR